MKALQDHGQAVWLDFLSRGFVAKGGLKKLVDEDGVRGRDLEPVDLRAGHRHSDEYDDAIAQIAEKAATARRASCSSSLPSRTSSSATDVLRPVFDATNGADGFVSIEVSPYLAKDTKGTIAEAKRLWHDVDRKNLMIKVPGDARRPAGDPAT